jgi:hypothetical protein
MEPARFEHPSHSSAGSEYQLRWNVKQEQRRENHDRAKGREHEEKNRQKGGVSAGAHAFRL